MLKAITKKRLLILADFLDTVPPKKFNLSFWGHTPDGMELNHNKDNIADFCDVAHKCGTTACALGWAATIPQFHKAGLKLVDEKYFEEDEDTSWDVVLYKRDRIEGGSYVSSDGFEAGQEFFQLEDVEQASYFFDPMCYPDGHKDAKYVARRIRTFVKTEGKSYERWCERCDHFS